MVRMYPFSLVKLFQAVSHVIKPATILEYSHIFLRQVFHISILLILRLRSF